MRARDIFGLFAVGILLAAMTAQCQTTYSSPPPPFLGTGYSTSTSDYVTFTLTAAGGASFASAPPPATLYGYNTLASLYYPICVNSDGSLCGGGSGTVTAVSVATANGISGTSSGGATPALTLTLGAIRPTSLTTPTVIPTGTTVAALPSSGNTTYQQYWVTDATSLTDCTVGSSSGYAHACQWSGSAWVTAIPVQPVTLGGTGLATLTAHSLQIGKGTSSPNQMAVCGTGVPVVGVTGADPICSASGALGTNAFNSTTIPAAQVAANLASSGATGVTGQLPIGQVGSAGLSASGGVAIASTGAISLSGIPGSAMTNNTVTATQLAAQYSKGSCTEAWGGSGTSHALTSGDDAVSNNTCYNDSGVTRTITAVKCRNDNASNTTTVNPTFGSAGTGTTILSGALTCGNSYAYSSTGTVSNASWTTGTGITPAMAGTLTGTSVAMIVEYTF